MSLPHLPTTTRMDCKYEYILICSILAARALMIFWQKIALCLGEIYLANLAKFQGKELNFVLDAMGWGDRYWGFGFKNCILSSNFDSPPHRIDVGILLKT